MTLGSHISTKQSLINFKLNSFEKARSSYTTAHDRSQPRNSSIRSKTQKWARRARWAQTQRERWGHPAPRSRHWTSSTSAPAKSSRARKGYTTAQDRSRPRNNSIRSKTKMSQMSSNVTRTPGSPSSKKLLLLKQAKKTRAYYPLRVSKTSVISRKMNCSRHKVIRKEMSISMFLGKFQQLTYDTRRLDPASSLNSLLDESKAKRSRSSRRIWWARNECFIQHSEKHQCNRQKSRGLLKIQETESIGKIRLRLLAVNVCWKSVWGWDFGNCARRRVVSRKNLLPDNEVFTNMTLEIRNMKLQIAGVSVLVPFR